MMLVHWQPLAIAIAVFVRCCTATDTKTKAEANTLRLNNNNTNTTTKDQLEQLLLSVPDPQHLRTALDHLTQRSHVAGTPGDWDNARYVRDMLRHYGLQDARIEAVTVMMTYPLERPQLVTSFGYRAKLSEDILPNDVTSGTSAWTNHTFLAYSPSGTVTAKLVYANYGRPEDFEALEQLGVSVKGAIVMMRYGECFRGLKIMNAEARGAIGSIIYSDPQQDGYNQGSTFADGGPWRPPSGVQRGSVQHISKCAGDPWRLYLNHHSQQTNTNTTTTTTTTTTSSTIVKDLCGYDTADMIPKHVALPLSYEDAQPLLERLGGPTGPPGFQGGLPLMYSVGPSNFDVTITTNHTFYPRKIPNVVASIPAEDPDKEDPDTVNANNKNNKNNNTSAATTIILGNHRDAWVFGAVDPNSGTTALLEVARTLQVLRQQGGWKPKRSIVFTSWSGEEYGLLGSTAYAELYASQNTRDVIAYLNVDCAVTGNVSLNVSATHSLNTLIRQAAEKVPAPPLHNNNNNQQQKNRTMADITVWDQKVETLGSGSDYTAFLDRLGIASLDMSFRGNYGVYHSVYDSFSWMTQQGDPTFEIHQAMTRLWALMAFRLASSEILPIYMTPQAEQIEKDVQALTLAIQKEFGDDQLTMTKLQQASKTFTNAANAIDRERREYEQSFSTDEQKSDWVIASDINRRLSLVERQFLGPGLPKRPWFRHVLQAPGFYLGYGSQAFPGVVQALQDHNADMAQREISVVTSSIFKAAAFLANDDSDDDGITFDLYFCFSTWACSCNVYFISPLTVAKKTKGPGIVL